MLNDHGDKYKKSVCHLSKPSSKKALVSHLNYNNKPVTENIHYSSSCCANIRDPSAVILLKGEFNMDDIDWTNSTVKQTLNETT